MSKDQAKKIAQKYAQKLKEQSFPFSAIYLFGSYAKDKAENKSDIDIAVVSKKLNEDYNESRFSLWDARLGVDNRIEPHGFTPADFRDPCNPLADQIKKTGIKLPV